MTNRRLGQDPGRSALNTCQALVSTSAWDHEDPTASFYRDIGSLEPFDDRRCEVRLREGSPILESRSGAQAVKKLLF